MAKTILLIEDEPDFRLYLATFLEDSGYEPIILEDGADVIETIEERNPDLVVLDFMMPGRSGLSICKDIRTRWAPDRLPILLVTGLLQERENDDDGLARTFADNDVPFPEAILGKPFAPAELLETVERLVG